MSRAETTGLGLLALGLLYSLAGYAPELVAGPFYFNDYVPHLTASERMADAVRGGSENPIDVWMSEWVIGYPFWHSYQFLGHALVVLAWLATVGTVALPTVFAAIGYLVTALFPLAVYLGLRGLGGSRLEAGAAAALAPILKSAVGFGLEAGSYAFYGSGLFTQALGALLLPLAIAAAYRALRGEGSPTVAGALVGITFLAHFIYGFAAVWSALLALSSATDRQAAAGRDATANRRGQWLRIPRAATLLAAAAATVAFVVVPMAIDAHVINHSRWEPAWKWDSFGSQRVLADLFTGAIFDSGRFPVVTLLVGAGFAFALVRRHRQPERFLLLGFLFWLLFFFGRPTWGKWLSVFGASRDLHLHRLIGVVHLFGLWLAGIGFAAFVARFARAADPRRAALVAVSCLAVLAIPYAHVGKYFYRDNAGEIFRHRAAIAAERASIDALFGTLRRLTSEAQGRVFAGLPSGWGESLKFGGTSMHAMLSLHHVPALARMYHSMSMAGEAMVHFDERRPSHYRVYGVSVVAADRGRALPSFLVPFFEAGRYGLYHAPGGGYFDVVRVPFERAGDADAIYATNRDWLAGSLVDRGVHVRLRFPGEPVATDARRLGDDEPLPDAGPWPPESPGRVLSESRSREVYAADVDVREPSHLLFRMTYHPRWRALVDGVEAPTEMLTPAMLGVRLEPGRHSVRLEYVPGPLKPALLVAGVAALLVLRRLERRLRFA